MLLYMYIYYRCTIFEGFTSYFSSYSTKTQRYRSYYWYLGLDFDPSNYLDIGLLPFYRHCLSKFFFNILYSLWRTHSAEQMRGVKRRLTSSVARSYLLCFWSAWSLEIVSQFLVTLETIYNAVVKKCCPLCFHIPLILKYACKAGLLF